MLQRSTARWLGATKMRSAAKERSFCIALHHEQCESWPSQSHSHHRSKLYRERIDFHGLHRHVYFTPDTRFPLGIHVDFGETNRCILCTGGYSLVAISNLEVLLGPNVKCHPYSSKAAYPCVWSFIEKGVLSVTLLEYSFPLSMPS